MVVKCPYCGISVTNLISHMKGIHTPNIYNEFMDDLKKFIDETKNEIIENKLALTIHELSKIKEIDEETVREAIKYYYPEYFMDHFIYSTQQLFKETKCFCCGNHENLSLFIDNKHTSLLLTDIFVICKNCKTDLLFWTDVTFQIKPITIAHNVDGLHGHTFNIKIKLKVPVFYGTIINLTSLEKRLNILLDQINNTFLNEILPIPTIEWLLLYLFRNLDVTYSISGLKEIYIKDGINEVSMNYDQYKSSKFTKFLYSKIVSDFRDNYTKKFTSKLD
ncbi:MAG: hypothetical protein KatS3mg002_0226 [Candidatus Woesearchaeota archaeon]|nr:MAG: hypothetical protein KatS3mg002_0226 [Candidatus Woesearchaeota archaeon]